MSIKLFYFGVASLCLLYLFWRGGAPERCVGIIAMIGSIVSPLVESGHVYHRWEAGIWLIDTAMFFAMLYVAIKANRYWPIWVAAIQLCSVLGHVGAAIDRQVLPSAYYLMTAYSAYIHWMLLVAGGIRHQRRLLKYRVDPPWRMTVPTILRGRRAG